MMIPLTPDNAVDYLQRAGLIRGPADVEPLGGGVSNVVLRITPQSGAAVVLKQSREKLRTRAEWRSRLERIWREADVMRLLDRLVPGTAPRILFEDRPNYVLVMEAIDREHVVWKDALLAGRVDPALADTLGDLLGRIHLRSWGDPAVAAALPDAEAFEELRLDPYYRHVAVAHPVLAGELDRLITGALERREALVLGDFSPKNILLTAGGVRLVDFETGHCGDPTFDLGFFLTHIALKGVRAGARGGSLFDFARQFWHVYARTMAAPIAATPGFEPRVVRHWAACLLARIDGKSPVDYLDGRQQTIVREFAIGSRLHPAERLPEAVDALRRHVERSSGGS